MGGFRFKQFGIEQDRCAMKVGTDGVLLGAWAEGGKRILDIGSGTGLISLMMAQRYPEAQVLGIDIDPDACQQARENVAASPFGGRVAVECCALQEMGRESEERRVESEERGVKSKERGVESEERRGKSEEFSCLLGGGPFDAIVSNPPFFVNSMKNPDNKRSLARHADSLPFSELMKGAKRWLSEDGVFSVIVPTGVVEQIVTEACCSGLSLWRKCGVKTVERKQPKRFLLAFVKKRRGALEEDIKTMTDSQGNRSSWYAKITEDFYL